MLKPSEWQMSKDKSRTPTSGPQRFMSQMETFCKRKRTGLLAVQHRDRIHVHRAAGRQPAGGKGDQSEDGDNDGRHDGVKRLEAVDLVLERLIQQSRADNAQY